MIIGLDPGQKAPAHVWIDTAGLIRVSRSPITIPEGTTVFAESQFPRPKSSRQSLLTLGHVSGLHEGGYLIQGARIFRLKPEDWRNEIKPRSGRMPKTVFHNICIRDGLIPKEIQDDADVCDAYLIREAGIRMLERGAKLRRLTW